MSRQARSESIDPLQVQIVHCVHRCVRRAFLCGVDPYTGQSYEHRRAWIRERLEFLASIFGIDCLTYTVLSNHLHVVLRSRPDVVATWSDREVARRWLLLFPRRKNKDGSPAEPVQVRDRHDCQRSEKACRTPQATQRCQLVDAMYCRKHCSPQQP